MNIVVIGASSGLGRCIGVGLGQQGERVALLARRYERLVEAAGDLDKVDDVSRIGAFLRGD